MKWSTSKFAHTRRLDFYQHDSITIHTCIYKSWDTEWQAIGGYGKPKHCTREKTWNLLFFLIATINKIVKKSQPEKNHVFK